jgi:hypothetical protein
MARATEDPRQTLGAEALRTTRYSDVCGGTDEFKRLLLEEPATATTPEGRASLRALLDDGMYMLARMEVRLREYQAFRDTLARLTAAMRAIEEPRLADAAAEAEAVRARLQELEGAASPAERGDEVRDLIDRVEAIRQVANDMEGALRRHKEGAIEAGRAYLRLRGDRGWDDGLASPAGPDGRGQSVPAAGIPPGVPEAWLPPSPHREVIVDWLRRGRAALLSEAEAERFPPGPQGREPLVQFEDGGVMPLRVVRWSEEVQNFYPLGTTPHPRSRLYRRTDQREAVPASG